MRAILIDTKTQTCKEIEVKGLEGMQKAVGGLIERALIIDDDNELYVNEEGCLDEEADRFFTYSPARSPFAGDGLIIGYEEKTGANRDSTLSLEHVQQRVRFFDRMSLKVYLREESWS